MIQTAITNITEGAIEQRILEIGFKIKPFQIKVIKQVLDAYLIKKKAYVVLNAPTGCFTGSTPIIMIRGQIQTGVMDIVEVTFQQLYDAKAENFQVYTYENNEIKISKVKGGVKLTKSVDTLVRVYLSNGNQVECTPEHQWLLKNGTYKEAQHLTPSDILMPLNKRETLQAIRIGNIKLDEKVPVYDIELESESHNFALGSNVFVHNSGKSLLGYIIADFLKEIDKTKMSSLILMHTNTLVDQYMKSFSHLNNIEIIKGADNYRCEVLDENTAENCIYDYQKSIADLDLCNRCEYKTSRRKLHVTPHVITNYSYFFIAKLFANLLPERHITVYDEAHLMNEVFCDLYVISISKERIEKIEKEITGYIQEEPKMLLKTELKSALGKLTDLDCNALTIENYMEFLTVVNESYARFFRYFQSKAEGYLNQNDLTTYLIYNKMYKKYYHMQAKIAHLFTHIFPHIADINEETRELTVKSIFIRELFDKISNSKYHLFMSGTIDAEYIHYILDIPLEEIEYIEVPAPFATENKKITFIDGMRLNYKTQSDPALLKRINDNVDRICQKHCEDNGIIQTHSYQFTKIVADELRNRGYSNIFEHKQGEGPGALYRAINAFKASKDPSILISPSLFEGVDLPDDLCRYQILIKAPYPSLGDKRIKHILDNFSYYYNMLTMFKIFQGLGRSVRNENDFSTTYCLDYNIRRLFFMAPENLQKQYQEFTFK